MDWREYRVGAMGSAEEIVRTRSYEEIYCPKCNFDDKTGATKFEGELYNPCDPGCCSVLYCPGCKSFYGLKKLTEKESAFYKGLVTIEEDDETNGDGSAGEGSK